MRCGLAWSRSIRGHHDRQAGEDLPPGSVLISQTLSQTRRGRLREPLVTCGTLPLRQPVREIIPGECQSADAIRLRADPECRVPQPASGAEPAIQEAPLPAVRIGANRVAVRDRAHTRILTPTCGRSLEISMRRRIPSACRPNSAACRGYLARSARRTPVNRLNQCAQKPAATIRPTSRNTFSRCC